MSGGSRKFRIAAEMLGAVLLLWLAATGAGAQPKSGLLAPGDAAVAGFSGAPLPVQISPGIETAEKTFIDLDGPSLRVFDLQDLRGPAEAQLVRSPRKFTAKAGQIGQVFGVALDNADPPNIYAAASSAYGLPIVVADHSGEPLHVRNGSAAVRFMPGLWGPGGGPGAIWKIDGQTGAISLFADVTLDGRKNSGPALGGLAFDPRSQSLYVADRETGMIQSFGPDGVERGHYDHGVTGREALTMKPVPFDPARRLDIDDPRFDSGDPATWNYAPPERLVYGVAVAARRLYYAVAAGQQIWSIGLSLDGAFLADPRLEIVVPPAAGPTEISKIAFDEQGRMFLAERPAPTGAFDFEKLTQEGVGRVLRYARLPESGGWRPLPEEYAIGFPLRLRNANGGVAISYLYDGAGRVDRKSCGGFFWATGEDLRASADPALAARLRDWGPEHVQGLQGEETWRIRRDNEPPLHAWFTDYDDHFDDFSARGHMGDVAIWRTCGLAEAFDEDFVAAEAARGGVEIGAPAPGLLPPLGAPPRKPPRKPPPSHCTALGACPPPPPPACNNPNNCPPCQQGERRGRDGQCQPISCQPPSALIANTCCEPRLLGTPGCSWCQAGQVSVGPSNSCCPSGQVYTGANGVAACCSGTIVNGQCQPGNPNVPVSPQCQPGHTPPCCSAGYVTTGTICCLASQATANGVCCPVGEIPVGDQCQPLHFTPPGPSCCAAVQTMALNNQCCATANITTQGVCCALPVDPQYPGQCPAQTQSIVKCQPGYTRMPDKSCCLASHVSTNGQTCRNIPRLTPPLPAPPPVVRKPPVDCSARGPHFIANPRDPTVCVRCPRGLLANDGATACVRAAAPPPRRIANCAARGPRFIANPDNPSVCIRCGRGMVANAGHDDCIRVAPPPPRVAHCAARGPRFINSPDNPSVCIRCPLGMIANARHDDCVPFAPPPGFYGAPPGWRGPWRPRQPLRPWGPGPFRPGPANPGGAVAPGLR